MARLKCAVIGVGKMGVLHCAIAHSHPDVEVVGICDTSAFLLRMIRGVKDVPTYTDYRKLLEDCRPDFAIVAVPVKYHFPIILDLLRAGVSVFTEKPFTKTCEQADRLLAELASQPRLKGQVGYVNRYHSYFREVRRLLAEGYVGHVLNFSMEMYGGVVLRELRDSWRSDRDVGGGCLMEFATHSVDLVNYYFGKPKAVRSAAVQSIYSKNVEDYVHGMFEYENGVIGWLNANWSDETCRMPSNIVTINGSGGKIVAREHQLSVYLKEAKPPYTRGWNKRYITDLAEPVRIYVGMDIFTRQLDDFIDALLNDREPENSFASARDTGWIIAEMYRKAGVGG